MIRTIIWFIYFWLYLIYVIPTLNKAKRLYKNNQIAELDSLVYKEVVKWAKSLVKLTGSSIKVIGEENLPKDEAVVFIGNHQGNFDIPILLGYIDKPKAFIAKIEILKLPFIRTWMKYMKCVFMDRNDIRQSLKVINEASDYVKQGYSMVIFPEGKRSKGSMLGEFKPGSLKLALKSGAPIIPFTIKGSYKIMEQNKFIIKPASVEIILSEAIPTAGISKEEAAQLPEKIRSIIENNL